MAAHRLFVAHRLSPGGAADLLAATCFVHALDSEAGAP
jgi:triphosphoribosyl-dephospho-CoA synthase